MIEKVFVHFIEGHNIFKEEYVFRNIFNYSREKITTLLDILIKKYAATDFIIQNNCVIKFIDYNYWDNKISFFINIDLFKDEYRGLYILNSTLLMEMLKSEIKNILRYER